MRLKKLLTNFAIIIVAAGFITAVTFAVIEKRNRPSVVEQTTETCRLHQGVRSINDDEELVICRDGHIAGYSD